MVEPNSHRFDALRLSWRKDMGARSVRALTLDSPTGNRLRRPGEPEPGERVSTSNLLWMAEGPSTPHHAPPSLIERRIRKIADARSITLALSVTFLGLAVAGAIAIRFLDHDSFPTYGSAFWWALQTVTTVGYGDVVPTGTAGKVIGSIEMVLGVSFISFLTAGVTSAVVQRAQERRQQEQHERVREDNRRLAESLTEIKTAIAALDARLDRLS
jgi:Ion channel